VRRGLAPTPKSAWLLSFTDDQRAADIHLPLPERLAPLPLKLLDDFPIFPTRSTPCAGRGCTPWGTSWRCRRRPWGGAAAGHSPTSCNRHWANGRTCRRTTSHPPPSATNTGSATR
jgi:hypothetical protein